MCSNDADGILHLQKGSSPPWGITKESPLNPLEKARLRFSGRRDVWRQLNFRDAHAKRKGNVEKAL